MRGNLAAQQIQLSIEYAPEPPFDSGTPKTADPAVLKAAQDEGREMAEARLSTAIRIGRGLGIEI